MIISALNFNLRQLTLIIFKKKIKKPEHIPQWRCGAIRALWCHKGLDSTAH